MKSSAHSLFLCLALLSAGFTLHAAETTAPTTAPYLLAGAPSFDQSISQFREAFNQANPTLQLDEFRAIDGPRDTPTLTRAASKINENLYASTALERGALKIKSMQITAGKNKRYYADTEGAIRYVVADNGEKGLTFAVEPIKLALSDTLGGAN